MKLPDANAAVPLAKRGARWSFVGLVARYFLSFAGTAILSRLLPPSDFGLMALATTASSFFQFFSDLGLGWATIRSESVSPEELSALFWINAGAGAILWTVCVALGPALNIFFHRTELTPLSAACGFALFLGTLAVQPSALLRRGLQIQKLSLIQFLSTGIGTAVAVLMAICGFGIQCLVAQAVITPLATLLMVFPASGMRILPPKPRGDFGRLARLSGYLTVFSILNYFAKSTDNLIVGKFRGPIELAYYARAYFLMTLPGFFVGGALDSVIVPTLAALRNQSVAFERAYRESTIAVALLSLPLCVVIGMSASELIPVVYGRAWYPVVPLLRWLSLGGFFFSLHCFIPLYLVLGHERELARWSVIPFASLTAGFIVGIHWGSIGVAIAYALIMGFVVTPLGLTRAHRCASLPLAPLLRGLLRPACSALSVGLAMFFAGFLCNLLNLSLPLVLISKLMAATLVFAIVSGRQAFALARSFLS